MFFQFHSEIRLQSFVMRAQTHTVLRPWDSLSISIFVCSFSTTRSMLNNWLPGLYLYHNLPILQIHENISYHIGRTNTNTDIHSWLYQLVYACASCASRGAWWSSKALLRRRRAVFRHPSHGSASEVNCSSADAQVVSCHRFLVVFHPFVEQLAVFHTSGLVLPSSSTLRVLDRPWSGIISSTCQRGT